MTATVALIAVGVHGHNAVGSRIGAFAQGLTRCGWGVMVLDPCQPRRTPLEWLLGQAPSWVGRALESVGVEGDVRLVTGWTARRAVRTLNADVAVVSLPPFSLLGTAALALADHVPLVVDYRDPWSARRDPPLLARVTRVIERHAVRRAAAVVYAGGPALGDLLVRHLQLLPDQVISVPNGFDPHDVAQLNCAQFRLDREGQPLRLVMNGYWYGRNGPGILLDALACVGSTVVELTVLGGVSQPIMSRLRQATGRTLTYHISMSRRELYQRIQQADAAVVVVDHASAVESRIPAKVYDYLATGVPVIAICPDDAALLHVPGAGRFHHIHPCDVDSLVTLLVRARHDRTVLRAGMVGAGPSREQGIETLHTTLRGLVFSRGT